MKIFLTGANGQLAHALQDVVARRSADSVRAYPHHQLDIVDAAAVDRAMAEANPDVVINAAAYNLVDQAETDPAAAFAVNETGPRNLAVAAAARNIPIVHVSTDYVFDGTLDRPYRESDPTNPLNQYAKSKLAGEKAVLAANPRSYVARTAWVFYKGGRNFLLGLLVNKGKPTVSVANDQFGSPTYALHLAEKILTLLDTKAAYGVYHLAGRGGTSRYELAKRFFEEAGLKTTVLPASVTDFPSPARRPRATPLDTERGDAFRLPPWEQGVSEFAKEIKDGMRDTKN